MNDRFLKTAGLQSAGAAALAAMIAAAWSLRLAISVAAGGAWNLASLWCFARVLRAWMGPAPSTGRAVLWVAIKFPLLYFLTYHILSSPSISAIGFGIGFSVVLFFVLARFAVYAQQLVSPRTNGR